MKGIDGANQIQAIMDKFRQNPPKEFASWKVLEYRDYKTGITQDYANGTEHSTGLPESNVLYFALSDDAWCCARPSGTEPKIKFYMGVKGTSLEDAAKQSEALTDAVKALI